MIKSMTGFGQATHEGVLGKYTIEIKSLNSKFLEMGIKLPKVFSDKELLFRNDCSKLIERGKVVITITLDYYEAQTKGAVINKTLFEAYYKELKGLAEQLEGPDSKERLFDLVINMPDVVQQAEEAADEDEWLQVQSAFREANARFQAFRASEGAVLKEDLSKRVQTILELLSVVEEQEPLRLPVIKERIRHFLSESVGRDYVDENRFEQELIYYIDKLDITEEKVRLRSHCRYFTEVLGGEEASGKKLGFISQEIGREINTLGAKANQAKIQQTVVLMKEELEKIKEQLLNIL